MTQVLRQLTPVHDPNILIGPETADDVGAYRISDTSALVMTTDFFAPVVDDPYWFGAIAAANSLSDMYAKGVQPIAALNIVAFPSKKLGMDVLSEILRGGGDKVREAGAAVIGGHSVDDEEPKYGLAVVGIAHPDRIIANSTAKPGDLLVLTKPLGIGIITTGIKREMVDAATERQVTELMATLNRSACAAMLETGVHAATDVTGYGLLGHLREILAASGVSCAVHLPQVPILPATWNLIEKKAVPGGSLNNLKFLSDFVSWGDGITEAQKIALCDAQTSGGLLISVGPERADQLLQKLAQHKSPAAAVIGEVIQGPAGKMQVLNR